MQIRHRTSLRPYQLEPEQVRRLRGRALELWPAFKQHLEAFNGWLQELQT